MNIVDIDFAHEQHGSGIFSIPVSIIFNVKHIVIAT